MKYGKIIIRTQFGTFEWLIPYVYFKNDIRQLDKMQDRCIRAIKQGSVGPLVDWTVGNHGQVNAPALPQQETKAQILSVSQVVFTTEKGVY